MWLHRSKQEHLTERSFPGEEDSCLLGNCGKRGRTKKTITNCCHGDYSSTFPPFFFGLLTFPQGLTLSSSIFNYRIRNPWVPRKVPVDLYCFLRCPLHYTAHEKQMKQRGDIRGPALCHWHYYAGKGFLFQNDFEALWSVRLRPRPLRPVVFVFHMYQSRALWFPR